MDEHKLSIIVPVYKAEKHIRQCLDSIVGQEYPNWECILINDGSPDSSGDICDEYAAKDKRFIVVHKTNAGAAEARNDGLRKATGDYITFVDSDDELLPQALVIYHDAIVKYGNIDVIKAGYIKHFEVQDIEKKHSCGKETLETSKRRIVRLLNEESYYHGFLWNECIRRELIGDIKFDNGLHWNEDSIFSFQLFLKAESVLFSPQLVYKYYIRETESLSNVKDPYLVMNTVAKILDYRLEMAEGDQDLITEFGKNYTKRFHDSMRMLKANIADISRRSQFRDMLAHKEILAKDFFASVYLCEKTPYRLAEKAYYLLNFFRRILNKIH